MAEQIESLVLDVTKLKEKPSLEVRAQITDKISALYQHGIFKEKELRLAEEILGLLSKDSEIEIRKILVRNLKNSTSVPKELALRLAKDVEAVAVPMLEISKALSEQDLLAIIKSTIYVASVAAIARRDDLSEVLANAIVDKSYDEAVTDLVENQQIKLSDKTLDRVIQQYHASGNIITALVERGGLSSAIIDRIMASVSEQLRDQLVREHQLDQKVATKIMDQTQEQAIMSMLVSSDNPKQLSELVSYLHQNKRLTGSMMMRSLCKGNITFFELAVAKLANIDEREVHNILFSLNQAEIVDLFSQVDLPNTAYDAIYLIVKFIVEDISAGKFHMTTHSNRIIEKIIAGGYDKTVPMMQHLVVLICSKAEEEGDDTNAR
jgi:uncharacterized protein (DUF2336 family)